ncbi:hypothetical protein [Rubritalea tangerina]
MLTLVFPNEKRPALRWSGLANHLEFTFFFIVMKRGLELHQ